VWVCGRCEVGTRQGVEGRTGPKGSGEAHVAEWRRVGAKRVLGDVGRGGGVLAEVGRNGVARVNAAMWLEAANRGDVGMMQPGMTFRGV